MTDPSLDPEAALDRLRSLFAAAGEADPWTAAEARLEEELPVLWHAAPWASDTALEELAAEFRSTGIPETGRPIDDYLDELLPRVVARSVHVDSPRFIGHMTSALPRFVPLFSRLLVELNQNQVKTETSRAMTLLERQAIAMLHRLVYRESEAFYDAHTQDIESALGIQTSGGTAANLTALWCARNLGFPAEGGFAGIESEGLVAALAHCGASEAVVVGSQLMHYSFKKIAGILGIGEKGLLTVPADTRNRIELGALRERLDACRERRQKVIALVGIAGSTETGSVDPLPEMAAIAREHGIHFHVDAAWGGPTLFSRRHAGKLAGIELADSVTVDGHKQLYLPMGIGLLLFKNPKAAKAIEKHARYTIRAGSGDLGKRSLEGSRPAMVLYLHAGLNLIGREGYEALIDSGIHRARFLAEAVRRRPEFELLAEPELNLVVYRYVPEAFREAVRKGRLAAGDNAVINEVNEALQRFEGRAGQSFVSRTALETTRYGRDLPIVALRAVLANPLTSDADLEAVLDEQVERGGEISLDPVLLRETAG